MLVRFCRCWLVGFFHGQPADRTRSGQHRRRSGGRRCAARSAVLAGMRCDAGEIAETLWAARGPDELMDTYAEIEALKCALDALALDVVRELDATDAVKQVGWASTQDFVTSVAGGHKGTGPAVVRLARAVDEPVMAPVGEAMRDGWLSTTKAQVIERAIDDLPGDSDARERGVQALLAEAKGLDATELLS